MIDHITPAVGAGVIRAQPKLQLCSVNGSDSVLDILARTYLGEKSLSGLLTTVAFMAITTIKVMVLITRQTRIIRLGLPEPVPQARRVLRDSESRSAIAEIVDYPGLLVVEVPFLTGFLLVPC